MSLSFIARSLFTCCTVLFTIQQACAQKTYAPKPTFDKHELGISGGFANYEISALFGGSARYNTGVFGVKYNFRPAKHFQIGVKTDIGNPANTSGSFLTAFTMSFPIGGDRSYFYPGWQFNYLAIPHADKAIGVGLHMGGCIAVTPGLAVNIQTDASVLLFGTNITTTAGIIARL